jgi:hypothetical protein
MLHLVAALASALCLMACLYLIGSTLGRDAVRITNALLPTDVPVVRVQRRIRICPARYGEPAARRAVRRQLGAMTSNLDRRICS